MQFGWCYLSETFATRESSAIWSQYTRHHISPLQRTSCFNNHIVMSTKGFQFKSHFTLLESRQVSERRVLMNECLMVPCNDLDILIDTWQQHWLSIGCWIISQWQGWWLRALNAGWKSTRMIIRRKWRDLEIGCMSTALTIWLDDGYQQWHQRAKHLQNDGIFLLPFKLLLADRDLIPHHYLLMANIRHRSIPVSHYAHHDIICNAAYLYSGGISADGLLYDIQCEIL